MLQPTASRSGAGPAPVRTALWALYANIVMINIMSRYRKLHGSRFASARAARLLRRKEGGGGALRQDLVLARQRGRKSHLTCRYALSMLGSICLVSFSSIRAPCTML